MPLNASLVGRQVGHVRAHCDARWLMSYAAGVPDERPELFDTTTTLLAHPLFPVAPEWELLVTHRSTPPELTDAEVLRGVHAAHDLVLDRPLRAGETIDIAARVIAVGRRSAGALQHTLFEATDANGEAVWRTTLTSVFLGVELDGEPSSVDAGWPAAPEVSLPEQPIAVRQSHVRSVDAHVYTECARIWNPIHTDLAVARRAGFAAPILHGTATLARAVSIVVDLGGWALADVTRVRGAFTSMVGLDTTMSVRLLGASGQALSFDVLAQDGSRAISSGFVTRAGS